MHHQRAKRLAQQGPRPTPDSMTWLRRHRTLVVALIVFFGALIRVAYFIELNRSGLIDMHRWDQTDMHYYDAWARTVARGDWLSATIGPPMHQWQRTVAQAYLQAHPDGVERVRREADAAGTPDLEVFLWKRWMNTPQFYQDPLYIYGVAVIYRMFADDPRAVVAAQMILGVCTILLLWHVTVRCFGDAAALCAAAMALLCAPLVFYEGLLLRDSLVACVGLALLWIAGPLLANAPDAGRPTIARATAFGLAGGLACLLKSTFVALSLLIAVGIAIGYRHQLRRLPIVAAAMLTGFAIAVTPLALRNTTVGVAPLTLARLGGFTFVASNAADANPDVGWEINAPLLASFFSETNGSMQAAVRTALNTQSPGGYASLLWHKWDRSWHWFDIPNNENRYYVERHVPVLRWLRVTFWTVSPLAFVGLGLALPRFRRAWPLLLLVFCSAASVVLFVVLARQRVPLIAAAIPFAALTIVETVRFLRQRRYAVAVAVLGATAALAAWTGRPRSPDEFVIRTADWLLPFSIDGQETVDAAIARQDWAGAAAAYQTFFQRSAPTAVDAATAEDPTLISTLAKMHAMCARLRAQAGADPAQDIAEAETLTRMGEIRLSTAGPLQDTMRSDVEQTSTTLAAARHEFAATMNRSGVAAANAGRMTEAVADFRCVVRMDPQNSHAHLNLARALAADDELPEALVEARTAETLAPSDATAHALIAALERAAIGR